MGEPSVYCHPSPEGCCLELHETVVILVALIILVQLALKLATVICYYLCYLLGSLLGMVFAKAPERARAAAARPRRAHSRRPSARWSQQDVPRRRRLRSESSSPRRRCLHCTLEPLRVTMNLQQQDSYPFREHPRSGRRSHPDYPPCHAPPARCYHCDCEWRPRPRHASAPSGYGIPRYRDVGCGSSEPLLGAGGGGGSATERRTAPLAASDPFARTQIGEATPYRSAGPSQDTDYPATVSRTRRPAKVYIYPVHPQTPPGSRSPSPERTFRRRGAALPGPDEAQEYETPREQRRRARDAEQQLSLSAPPRFHSTPISSASPGGGAQGADTTKQRLYSSWGEQQQQQQQSGSDWVYRALK